MTTIAQLKKEAAQAALDYIPENAIVGVGTGTTTAYFIEALAGIKHRIDAAIPSSSQTEKLLRDHHIPIGDLNSEKRVDVYVDGADQATISGYLIKGGGGALTREKIIATVAKQFVCIVDHSKQVAILGENGPVPVAVIPLARSYVAREIVKLGGEPVYREHCRTDNENVILDVYQLDLKDPESTELALNRITGVVENGIFAHRRADILLVASKQGVQALG